MATNNVDWSPTYPQPAAALSAALIATGRTMVQPITPVSAITAVGPQATAGALTGTKYVLPPPGTVIATFNGSDLVDPYASTAVGLPVNLPILPNRTYPVSGARFVSGVDTSVYLVFMIPGNLGVQNIAVSLGVCVDSNPGNVDNRGTAAIFGAAIGRLVTGVSTVDNKDLPVDSVSPSGLLPTVPGTFELFTVIASGIAVPGSLHLLRITRRAGSFPALDMNQSDLLLISVSILTA